MSDKEAGLLGRLAQLVDVEVFLESRPGERLKLLNGDLRPTEDLLISTLVPEDSSTISQEELCKNFLVVLDNMLAQYEPEPEEKKLVTRARHNVRKLIKQNEARSSVNEKT